MTPCEFKLWQFIARTITVQFVPPSYQEMMDACGVTSKSIIAARLAALERQGVIKVVRNRKRGIELLRHPPHDLGILCSVTVDKHGEPVVWIHADAADRQTFASIRRGLDHAETQFNAIVEARLSGRAA